MSEPVVAPAPRSFDELVEAERRRAAGEGLVLLEQPAPAPSLHLVLEAGRCYGVSAVADDGLRIELRDEHGLMIADEAGRVVRLRRICPRWTGSFELRAEVTGSRAWIALYSARFSSASAESAISSDAIAP